MSKICVVLPEIFSKNLYFDRFSWIFCRTVGPKIVSIMFSLSTDWPKYLRNAKNLVRNDLAFSYGASGGGILVARNSILMGSELLSMPIFLEMKQDSMDFSSEVIM